ncbi:DUF1176 domain-containing protein [Nitratireductor kimnyeongensis]|uniref:DUF1176 domain-containing protein n=1 Tax=Nitratireductor kimnyeongensis TaxID=430679 RepID=A0ABW0T2Q5_9HYPH|nr:DUF1176 domain-containing protein [Nitratireductor kimnyeongensis]QZZ35316.1 DUF1176 domain-containing protein [Nitratireductor kimnyeongensis]
MKPVFTTAALLAVFHAPALAQDGPYLDDRSTPQALLQSLYNAINRKEYARAYDYFATPPATSLNAYAEGYADTDHVSLLTGTATSEGAAGSSIYALPVAIRARASDGGERVFAGCYTLRLANPQIQGTPYNPLHIENAQMKPATGELADALPASCGEGAPDTTDTVLEKARTLFASVHGTECPQALERDREDQVESHTIAFNYSHESLDTPKHEARLFRFYCGSGAYNETHAYILADEHGGLAPLQFAVPETSVQYVDGDPEGDVEDVRIVGYTADATLVNSDYDPDTLTLTSYNKWRGLGDAFSSGTWIFREGTFTLVRYDVDASYDGEQDPITVLDYHTGP